MLICHACLKLAKEPTPPGTIVAKCYVCHCTGNLVDRPDLAMQKVEIVGDVAPTFSGSGATEKFSGSNFEQVKGAESIAQADALAVRRATDPGCDSCGQPCSSFCPACGIPVHPYYGYMNRFCGLNHDSVCTKRGT